MLVVTVELWPQGDRAQARHLGTATIANDGTSRSPEVGNYSVTLSKWGRPKVAWRRGIVNGFRRQRFGPWDLLFAALAACVGDRLSNRDAAVARAADPRLNADATE